MTETVTEKVHMTRVEVEARSIISTTDLMDYQPSGEIRAEAEECRKGKKVVADVRDSGKDVVIT